MNQLMREEKKKVIRAAVFLDKKKWKHEVPRPNGGWTVVPVT